MTDEETDVPPRSFQFGLAKLLQFMLVAALWCAAAVVRENVAIGMAYTVVVVAVSWTVVGRWAVRLSPRACRRVLAGTTTLLVAGGLGVTVLVDDADYFPIVWMVTALAAAVPWAAMEFGVGWPVVVGVGGDVLLLLLVCLFWLAVFGSWDWLSARPQQNSLAWSFSALLVLLALPILVSVLGGCYAFREHGDLNEIHHLWLHCVIHVGMLIAAVGNVVLLQRHVRRSTNAPPNWLKLVTWGYLCFYAVLLQVALFPIHFYIP